jgi:hypothetical protein
MQLNDGERLIVVAPLGASVTVASGCARAPAGRQHRRLAGPRNKEVRFCEAAAQVNDHLVGAVDGLEHVAVTRSPFSHHHLRRR